MSQRTQGRTGARPVVAKAAEKTGGRELKKLRPTLLLFSLALLTLATFWKVLRNDFIYYDDNVYVTQNAPVLRGLTWQGLRWALTTGHAANWHPLTWLSHMTDVSLFGMNASGHHLTSLVLHIANTLLLFAALRSLTGAFWQSAFVAALFAVHPAHVESVAWVAERKDLLSTVFWLATMWAYGSWVRRKTGGRYALVLILFAAGLMSKPMLVTLPVVLLLLDYWPLSRFGAGDDGSHSRTTSKRASALVLEKAPLFLMAAASSVATFFAQRAGGAVGSLERYPVGVRIYNALVAYAGYLRMFFWPSKLAIFYPHPAASLSAWKILGSAVLLVALTVSVVILRRRAPYLSVGWFWFLVTLLPVIGLVQVGWQAMADRYTYIPFVGLSIALVWGVSEFAVRWRRSGRPALFVSAGGALIALMLAAMVQIGYWKNSETLFLHALAVTKDNLPAQNNLANFYNETGRPAEALPHLAEAMRIRPDLPEAYVNLGHSLFLMGRLDEAASNFSEALRLAPENATASNDLAWIRFVEGDVAEAIRLYELAVAAAPDWVVPRKKLAIALLMEGRTTEALRHLERAAVLAPQDAECRWLLEGSRAIGEKRTDPSAQSLRKFLASAHRDASAALERRGKLAEAAAHLRRSLELFPASIEAHIGLGALLVKEGKVNEGAAEFQEALRIDPGSALAHSNMGYTFFLRGRTGDAIEEYREALRLQPNLDLARNNLELALRQGDKKP